MTVRKPKKQLEVLWRGAKSFGNSADVFTHNFPTGMLAYYCVFQAPCQACIVRSWTLQQLTHVADCCEIHPL